MIEHAPPSAEPLTASVLDPNRVLDVVRLTPASQQVHAAEVTLGLTSHGGLTWERGDADAGERRRYVVREHRYERKAVIDPQTGRPVSSMRKVGPVVRKRTGLLARGRREVHEVETELVNTLYVDVYDGDDLVKVEKFPEAEFDSYIDDHGDEIGSFWWQEQETEPPRDLRINVDAPIVDDLTKDKPLVDYVRKVQQDYELRDWSGLRYRTYNDEGVLEQSEILRDVTMKVRTVNGWVNKRYFDVQTSNNDGALTRGMVPASNVEKVLNRTKRAILDIHFRVNRAELERRELSRELGKTALSSANRVSHVGKPLDVDSATDWLSGKDIYSGRGLKERKLAVELLPRYAEYTLALCEISEQFGTARLLDLAKRIQGNYVADAKKIGLAPKEDSISWVLWDLAKQYYLAHNKDEIGAKDIGIEDGSPLGYGPDHIKKQQQLIDRRIGEAFDKMLVKRAKLDQPEEIFIKQPDGSYAKGLRERHVVMKDEDLLRDLKMSQHVKNQLNAILDKITAEDRTLTYLGQVEIGRLLRREFAH